MFQELSHVLVLAVAKANAAVANAWRSATANQAGSYRPEAHYMRGPGPKWRAENPPESPRGGPRPNSSGTFARGPHRRPLPPPPPTPPLAPPPFSQLALA